MQEIKQNNDTEGWHHKFNKKGGRGQVQFYLLIALLHEEDHFVEGQTRLVRDNQLTCMETEEYRQVNAAINSLWAKFNESEI